MTEKTLKFWKNIYAIPMTSCVITDSDLNIVYSHNAEDLDLSDSLKEMKIRLYSENGEFRGLPENTGCYGIMRFQNRLSAIYMLRINDIETEKPCGYVVKFISPAEIFGGRIIEEPNTVMIREYVSQAVGGATVIRQFLEASEYYQQVPHVENVLESCTGLLSGITNSVQIGKIFTGKIKWCNCNVTKLTETALAYFRFFIDRDDLEIDWDLDPKIVICCDEDFVQTVVANLIVNGFMYNTSEKKKVKVSLKRKVDEMVLTVTDNGTGIPSGIMANALSAKAYSPFNPESISGSEGLGLVYVSLFAELMDGSLSYLSDSAGGSTVILRIPLESTRESFFKSSPQSLLPNSYSPLSLTIAKLYNLK